MRTTRWTAALVMAAVALAGCGSDDDEAAGTSQATATATAAAAGDADLQPVKDYLLEHSSALAASTAKLAEQGQAYAELVGDDPAAALESDRQAVGDVVTQLQETWRAANPQYEEMEGVVAGVPSLSEFDVIIDAGADKSNPENAVPFDVKLSDGTVLEQPGNFFFLTETTLFGTGDDFQADGKADLDGDGEVSFPEALPSPDHVVAFTRDFADQAAKLDAAAKQWTPSRQDALQALVTMTPTMSEYFGQWKASRFVAGDEATEDAFAAASRLQDIEDILSGLVLIYESLGPAVESVDAAQAEQIGSELTGLHEFAADLRQREEDGTSFDAEQADSLGAEAQQRAEAIAGQLSQVAEELGIELEA
jgi:hypothetical protein